jgi:glycoside/pentoside/hexuronide:cation symporter, GPH family
LSVSKWVSAGWASGTIGSSTALGAMSLLVLFYLTEYVGLSPALAGLLIFVSRLWDVFASFTVGQWSDRTQSRWGKRVPFLLVGAPVTALAYFMLFAVPVGLSGFALNAYVMLSLLLYATGYTLFVVPYLTVPVEITSVPHERTTMMTYRVGFMTLASLIVSGLGPVLIESFGGGRAGYVGMGAVHACIILVVMLGCTAIIARVPVIAPSAPLTASMLVQLRNVLKNKPFKIFIGVKFCQLMSTAAVGASLLYMARYILGEDEGFLVRFVTFQIAGTLLSLPAWSWLAKRYGKRLAYMASGYLYAAIALTWLFALGGEADVITNIRIFMIGVATTGLLVMGFSILPDTMEHNTKSSGMSQEGTLAAIYSMVEKGTAAFGPLIAGMLLEATGFIGAGGTDLPPTQPQSALVAILFLASVIPAVCNVAGSLLLIKFDLKDK